MSARQSVAPGGDAHLGQRLVLAALLGILLGISVLGLSFLAYGEHYAGRIFPGVMIQGVDVGGLTRQEALDRLRTRLVPEDLPYVSLYTVDQEWTVSVSKLGGQPRLEEAVQAAWALGRDGDFRADLKTRARLMWWGYRVVPDVYLEPGAALVYLRQIAKQVGQPARRAQIWVAGLQTRIGEAETGRELDIPATRQAMERQVRQALGQSAWGTTPRLARLGQEALLRAQVGSVQPVPVPLVFREVVPPLTEVSGARERVGLILSTPLTLEFVAHEFNPDGSAYPVPRQWTVDQALLSSWIVLQRVQTEAGTTVAVSLDGERIASYLRKIADELGRPPREARFDYTPKTNVLKVVTPGQNGYVLDVNAAQTMLIAACLSPNRRVSLPVRVIPPRVARADLEALLPLELVSEGESGFKGSTPERLQNIKVATAHFQGVTIPPQTAFSFLGHLGLVTVANGYSESWIIYGDRTILGPGGGVCQVSTTCFRAAFWGGFPLLERWAHSYRVGWYEPPLGLDAAVFSPLVDMKFHNDTDTPLLILTEVDEANAKLCFRFYGRRTGREVVLEGPTTSNPTKPGAPVLEEDATLAPGTRIQVDWPHDGLDVTLYRVIKKGGTVLARDRLFSRYEPWPARYRVGPARNE